MALLVAGMLLLPFHSEAGTTAAPTEGCRGCHAAIITGEYLHAPLRDKECGACHRTGPSTQPHQKGAYALKAGGASLCYSCHDRSGFMGPVRHAVTESCGACHSVHAASNEHLLKSPPAEEGKSKSPCYFCHDSLAEMKTVHSPVKQGSCSLCHLPHSAQAAKLLKAGGSDLCFRCHDREPYTLEFPHKPVAEGKCDVCHVSHQSDTPKLLRTNGSTPLCITCHGSSFVSGLSVHQPAAAGDCRRCHATHSSNNRKLLIRQFPEEANLAYDEDNYATCFKCHPASAFSDEATTGTGFRRGTMNLHLRHVKGYSCKVCHEFHASSQPRLVRTSMTAPGNFRCSLTFTVTPAGGKCTTSCHQPREYTRN